MNLLKIKMTLTELVSFLNRICTFIAHIQYITHIYYSYHISCYTDVQLSFFWVLIKCTFMSCALVTCSRHEGWAEYDEIVLL